jgi:hypothetical protein
MSKPIPILLLPLLLVPLSALPQDMATSAIDAAIDAGFSDIERQIIEKYYGRRPEGGESTRTREEAERRERVSEREQTRRPGRDGKERGDELPPGLSRSGSLPPGLARRETLPPGLARRDLPDDLLGRLPPAPPGYERQIVENAEQAAVVLIETATGKVADIIKDIIIPKRRD